jgi:hypothetical protein
MFSRKAVLFLLFAVSAPAAAETCKYVDADGRTIYSNTPSTPPKGAKKVKCFEDPTPAPQASRPERAPRNSDERKSSFPRVDDDTQKKRDAERRKILEEELASEQQQLDEARKQLAEQESVRTGGERNYQRFLERVQPYRDAVANHERNVEALTREIANLP